MGAVDICIVGGGLAGSTAAAMLGRADYITVLVDPHQVYPPEFRCEKLDQAQVALLRKTGLADAVLPLATPDREVWIARFGPLVEKRPNDQRDILYDKLVNTIRAEIPSSVRVIHGKVTNIVTSSDLQTLSLLSGEEISARLVILANGLNIGLRRNLGIMREIVSECHSISVGFDVRAACRPRFDFNALTYYPERAGDQMAYLALFPIGSTMRANLFVYRNMHDPWLRELRQKPEQTMFAAMPGLRNITGDFEVITDVKIRPVDLYVSRGHLQSGVVLVGDAFATSCPAAGTGASKVFTDVERLCNAYIPHWLASGGMGERKIAAFYADSSKIRCDTQSRDKAYYLRSLSTETQPSWRARRWIRYVGSQVSASKLLRKCRAIIPRVVHAS
jgi:2-polyprenyl-6-methoxyphenol hydroxylase-like FAD-dependent oxidoreductase